jgi:hypothetical protein
MKKKIVILLLLCFCLSITTGYGASIGMEFKLINPGSFMMGSPRNEVNRDDDESQHKVTLTKGFYMQTTEVTQAQWYSVMGSNPSKFSNCGGDCPVESVSWEDVQQFIIKLNEKENTKNTACQQKLSGNMPQGPGFPQPIVLETARISWSIMDGLIRMQGEKHIPWPRKRPTNGGCMICTEMYGNCVLIGRGITLRGQRQIRKDHLLEEVV